MSIEYHYNSEKVRLIFWHGSFKYYVSIGGGGRGSANCLHWLTGGEGGQELAKNGLCNTCTAPSVLVSYQTNITKLIVTKRGSSI